MSHTKVVDNIEYGYSVYKHVPLVQKQNSFIDDIILAENFLKQEFNTDNVTWAYEKYNIFSLLTGSFHYWNLFKDVGMCIRRYMVENLNQTLPKHMWIQAWLNSHTDEQLLTKHNHADDVHGNLHGYISINPQDTTTKFYNSFEEEKPIYSIDNKIGYIYIGKGEVWHEVIAHTPSKQKRITIGFDVMTRGVPTKNLGHIPITW
jgi:hypothetical protein|tara:strand:+ start:1488 stop:2099 length:612 start_codon:yes stop_codon:yes gene_type:complete